MTNYSVSANSEVGPLGSEQIPFCFDCGKKWAFKLLSRSCYSGDKAWTDGNDDGDNDDGDNDDGNNDDGNNVNGGDVDSGKNLHSMNGAKPKSSLYSQTTEKAALR